MRTKILVLLIALALSANLHAQVSIGELAKPAKGALLDLNKTVKGGLALSNVTLEDLHTIPATFPGMTPAPADLSAVKTSFRGAIVYHTGGYGIPIGVYVWNGTNWTFLDENCTLLDASRIKLNDPLLDVKVGDTETFSVSSGASARCAEGESYTWSVSPGTPGTSYEISTASGTTTDIIFKTIATYTVTLTVTSPFSSAPIQKTVSVNVTASGGVPAGMINANYGIVGETCLDVKKPNTTGQDAAVYAARKAGFPDGNYEKTYKFLHTAAYSDLSLDYIDPANIVEAISLSPPASAAAGGNFADNYYEEEFKIKFRSNIQDLVPASGDSLTVKLIASYTDANTDSKLAYLEIRVEDGTCVCPAKVSSSPETWLNFMCHNLGGLDIISSSQLIRRAHLGDWYRFGVALPSMENIAANDSYQNKNDYPNWPVYSQGGDWPATGTGGIGYPCPAGWRLPVKTEYEGIVANNTWGTLGSWNWQIDKFNNIRQVGDYLYLPGASQRDYIDGEWVMVANWGYYWCHNSSHILRFTKDGQEVHTLFSLGYGYSVRCVSAE
jgi:hypothetical protein